MKMPCKVVTPVFSFATPDNLNVVTILRIFYFIGLTRFKIWVKFSQESMIRSKPFISL
jgi:hypothetical protein